MRLHMHRFPQKKCGGGGMVGWGMKGQFNYRGWLTIMPFFRKFLCHQSCWQFCTQGTKATHPTYDTTHSYVWRDSFTCDMTRWVWMPGTTRIHSMYDMTTNYVTHTNVWCCTYEWVMSYIGCVAVVPCMRTQRVMPHMNKSHHTNEWVRNNVDRLNVWHDSFICVMWLIHVWHDSLGAHARNHGDTPYEWHASFICATWLIRMCDIMHSYVWHGLLIYVTWLIHTCDMTHLHAWYNTFVYVTWLIHMCDMSHPTSHVCVI